MSQRLLLNIGGTLLRTAFALGVAAIAAPAQINTDILEKHRADLQKQATDPAAKRERGTQPEDWLFALGDGVTTRQITFYSDGAPCYGRIFFPIEWSYCLVVLITPLLIKLQGV